MLQILLLGLVVVVIYLVSHFLVMKAEVHGGRAAGLLAHRPVLRSVPRPAPRGARR
jgi:hypothetical protein